MSHPIKCSRLGKLVSGFCATLILNRLVSHYQPNAQFLYSIIIEQNLPKTERDRSGIFFFRFHRFPFYKGLCFNKAKYKKYDRLGLQ